MYISSNLSHEKHDDEEKKKFLGAFPIDTFFSFFISFRVSIYLGIELVQSKGIWEYLGRFKTKKKKGRMKRERRKEIMRKFSFFFLLLLAKWYCGNWKNTTLMVRNSRRAAIQAKLRSLKCRIFAINLKSDVCLC